MRLLARCALLLAFALPSLAQSWTPPASWTRPVAPFRIAGNLYYVGSEELAAYLIATPKGLILLNSNLAGSVPQIRQSIETLGFKYSNIRMLLISQGHFDHCAGSAQILKETGANYYVMTGDAGVVQSGGHTDFFYANDESTWFEPAPVDHALEDGEQVRLGGMVLTAHLTAGHTKGTTSWSFDIHEGKRLLHVVIVGGPNVNPGYKLVANNTYPQIADDFVRGFDALDQLPCDIFLGAHGSYFGLTPKLARLHQGNRDAFVDPAGYKTYLANRRQAFVSELTRQRGY